MSRSSLIIAFATVAAGALTVIIAVWPQDPATVPLDKTDRLRDESRETAFMPERFGVPVIREQ